MRAFKEGHAALLGGPTPAPPLPLPLPGTLSNPSQNGWITGELCSLQGTHGAATAPAVTAYCQRWRHFVAPYATFSRQNKRTSHGKAYWIGASVTGCGFLVFQKDKAAFSTASSYILQIFASFAHHF